MASKEIEEIFEAIDNSDFKLLLQYADMIGVYPLKQIQRIIINQV